MNLLKTMIIISTLSMTWWRKNIIMLLLSLELLLMSMFMTLSLSFKISSPMSLLMIITMMVSGSSIGLSLLVIMSNSHKSSNSIFINMLTFDKNPFNTYSYSSMFKYIKTLYYYYNNNNNITIN